jgi:hypothetical protein
MQSQGGESMRHAAVGLALTAEGHPVGERLEGGWLEPNDDYLRWRIRARLRRFLRPSLRRPLPDFLTPTLHNSSFY